MEDATGLDEPKPEPHPNCICISVTACSDQKRGLLCIYWGGPFQPASVVWRGIPQCLFVLINSIAYNPCRHHHPLYTKLGTKSNDPRNTPK